MNLALAIATVFATLFSPLIAVRVQKYLEKKSEKQTIKVKIFSQLMATRAISSRLLPEHVQALNMIDLAFYGDIRRGKVKRSDSEKKSHISLEGIFRPPLFNRTLKGIWGRIVESKKQSTFFELAL
ncbi:hypothetical protein LH671_00350 [Enterobacter kobei]|jgi:hypothetical protein|uniref:DUF6680 domain-containing protein n=1 Tax=Enterobacter kobei TaxID=208224 RepID=A0AAJ6LKE4_9ENTR|nr:MULTISPECIES: DUF6680 family protein [Enterobacter]MBO4157710.1 hypothetical protein [Enterobacter kobei]MCD0236323.1 hypothetical protein [Enterobacter kobei]MCE1221595.1 hypothetical protein [Enterobacter kobei]MCF1326417.1 hypothetical protein [Enterobacter kobei]MCK7017299.1 hypothetical protein [Enterobacter kobei]